MSFFGMVSLACWFVCGVGALSIFAYVHCYFGGVGGIILFVLFNGGSRSDFNYSFHDI